MSRWGETPSEVIRPLVNRFSAASMMSSSSLRPLGKAHPVDLGEVAILRFQDPAPEPDLPLTQRRIGHLENHGEHVLVDEEVLASKLEVVLEPFEVEEKGIAADADEKRVVPALHDPDVTVEGHRHIPEEYFARELRGPHLFARGTSHGSLLIAVL